TRLHSRINSAIMALLIVVIAGLLAWISTRYSVEFDWTRSGRHTLSEASEQVLALMEGPIVITAYSQEETVLRDAVRKFISRYQKIKPDIELHFVNPDVVPDEVRNLGVSSYNELVIRFQGRSQHVRPGNEEEFTNALLRLARGAEYWLAFVEGHGERNPLGEANFDLGLWVQQLTNRGFRTQPINLANLHAIPENTRVLVIAGPQVDLLPGEIQLILDYVEQGGSLLWLTDPGPLHGLEALAEKLHVRQELGTIIDVAGRLIGVEDPTIVIQTATLYPPHLATQGFTYTTLFPKAAAITAEDNSPWRAQPLLTTGDHTWSETGPLEDEVSFAEEQDIQGPLNIGLTLEREIESVEGETGSPRTQRILITGDGDFLSNTYVGNTGNLELGLRMLNWLSNDDEFIAIPARTAPDTQLELSQLASGLIAFGFLIGLPLLLFGSGAFIWWRRKKQ
ncbi:MAG: GldG family protein, partial [Gammaproteobacteria bacterium]